MFVKYYDTVMPLLRHILTSAQAKEHRQGHSKGEGGSISLRHPAHASCIYASGWSRAARR